MSIQVSIDTAVGNNHTVTTAQSHSSSVTYKADLKNSKPIENYLQSKISGCESSSSRHSQRDAAVGLSAVMSQHRVLLDQAEEDDGLLRFVCLLTTS